MSLPLAARTTIVRSSLRAARCPHTFYPRRTQTRTFLNIFKKSKGTDNEARKPKAPEPVLSQDNLFHLFSKSPFQTVRERGEAIKKLAPCPICLKDASHDHAHAHEPEGAMNATPPRKNVAFECPDCGWPTHCSEEHWKADEEHQRYCGRLKEANEDEHDLRSGRRMTEFEMPGAVPSYLVPPISVLTIEGQALWIMMPPFLSQTGISFGLREVSLQWTPSG